MQVAIYVAMAGMMGMMVFKMVKDMFNKNKKPQYVDIPRDAMERLAKAYKVGAKAKVNKNKTRHVLHISGDELNMGYRLGDVTAKQLQNEEYILYFKKYWWMFWKKSIQLHVDPELCTDFNAKHVVLEAKGIEAWTVNEYYLVPRFGTTNLERIYVQRAKTRMARVQKQTIFDLDVDVDYIPKAALRGDISAAMSEVGRYEEMPKLTDDELRKRQQKAYKEMSGEDD